MENTNKNGKTIIVAVMLIISLVFVFSIGYSLGMYVNKSTSTVDGDYLKTFKTVYGILNNRFFFREDSEEYREKLINDAIKGMVDGQGDIHTAYMSAEQLSQFTSSLESNFVGIGVRYVNINDNIVIVQVIRNSPAEAAGMLAGDIILAVDGKTVAEYGEDYIVDIIKGEAGTKVNVTVLREGKKVELAIIRNVISSTVTSRLLGDDVGYLEITSFSNGTFEDVGTELEYFRQNGVKRLLIDLRNDTGGYVDVLIYISSYFIPAGETVIQEEYIERTVNDTAQAKAGKTEIPRYFFDKIVVLVNEETASAAEAFTMVLKDHLDATVVGETTYGKGIGQTTEVFSDGSALKYTQMRWLSPKGTYIGGTGIVPDYEVKLHPAMYQSYLILDEGETLEYDQVGSKVQMLQNMLDYIGYEVDRMDGYFSKKTSDAVKAFQSSHGLKADGIVNEATATQISIDVVMLWNGSPETSDTQYIKAIELIKE
ncbi:MAG: PDZ domain-containing protein [Erysipelotrichaceae bacterium]|nr:PDZ domain-containing protein [Erysipelotrichaceae bacterium]